mgnify:CR=1 FL=1
MSLIYDNSDFSYFTVQYLVNEEFAEKLETFGTAISSKSKTFKIRKDQVPGEFKLKEKVINQIRTNLTPRHLPAKIIAVPDFALLFLMASTKNL